MIVKVTIGYDSCGSEGGRFVVLSEHTDGFAGSSDAYPILKVQHDDGRLRSVAKHSVEHTFRQVSIKLPESVWAIDGHKSILRARK